MAWVPDSFRDLAGVTKEDYVFVKCNVCRQCYRWGKAGFREGFMRCPVCGAGTSRPNLIEKVEYIQYLQRIGSPQALAELQQILWNPQNDY